MNKVLFVEYCAKDILDGTQNMDPLTELAYRRIIDMIYSTNDKLLDNDSLQYGTKTGPKWKKIRQELIEVHNKIYIEDGYIRNKKCTEKLAKSFKNIEQKSVAGKASAESRKSLENNKTGPTAVSTAVPTGEPTNQEPKNPKEDTNVSSPPIVPQTFSMDGFMHTEDQLFEIFWNGYSDYGGDGKTGSAFKGSRKDAKKIFLKLIKEGEDHERIITQSRAYAEFCPSTDTRCCYATTWLTGKRWETDYTTSTGSSSQRGGRSSGDVLAQRLARIDADAERESREAQADCTPGPPAIQPARQIRSESG